MLFAFLHVLKGSKICIAEETLILSFSNISVSELVSDTRTGVCFILTPMKFGLKLWALSVHHSDLLLIIQCLGISPILHTSVFQKYSLPPEEKRSCIKTKTCKVPICFSPVFYFIKEKLHTIGMPLDVTVHSFSCLAHCWQLDGSFNSGTNSVSCSVLTLHIYNQSKLKLNTLV